MCYEKVYYFFYYLASDYDNVRVNAESLSDAISIADAFSRKSGATIIGICSESLLNTRCYE